MFAGGIVTRGRTINHGEEGSVKDTGVLQGVTKVYVQTRIGF